MMTPYCSIVIPVYDERDNIEPLFNNITSSLSRISGSYEIIFVDDGSRDGSTERMEKICRNNPSLCRLIVFEQNFGQSSALAAGFRAALGEVIITMDADLQVDAGDIFSLLPELERFDLVCGYRLNRADSRLRRISSKIANSVSNKTLGTKIRDIGCPLKAMKREVALRMIYFDGMHRFIPVLAEMAGFSFAEVPVGHSPRLHGRSKYGIKNRIMKSWIDLRAVRWLQRRQLRHTLRGRED